jgi:hypothetical protein
MQSLKADMKRHMQFMRSNDEAIEIHLNKSAASQLNWTEEEEFEWHGEMYDVVEKKFDKNILVILCIPDKKEDQLLSQYVNDIQKDQSHSKFALVKLVSIPFTAVGFEMPERPAANIIHHYLPFYSLLLSFPHRVFSPPPEACNT